MEKIKIFCGEAVNDASPPNSEQEAVQAASFGAYNYDPTMRSTVQPNPVFLNGWSGFSTSQNQNNGFTAMNPPIYNPYYYNQPGLGAMPMYGYGNPAYQYFQQPTMMQQPQQNLMVHIDGINFRGEYLPPMDYEEKIAELQKEYWIKEQEQYAKQSMQSANYSNFGYNYYGNPYYNNFYQMNSLRSEVSQIISDMQNEARENRKQLNLQLSRLAHNICDKEYDETILEEMYTGKDIENPCGMTYADLYTQNRFSNLVPFDNSQMYVNQQLAVSAQYSAIIRPDADMKECFENMGVLNAQYELEKEAHRRRDYSSMYDSSDSGYKYFVRKKAAERYGQKVNPTNNNIQSNAPNNNIIIARSMMNQFPTLSNSGALSDDGTLTVTCNFGSKQGQVYSVNENEAKYDKNRENFNRFLDSIPKSIYTGG